MPFCMYYYFSKKELRCGEISTGHLSENRSINVVLVAIATEPYTPYFFVCVTFIIL
jgi:hypothetical protein